ncbi:MAG: cyclodeaminase/cyclohydrolase family protein [Acidobacteriota bacterium]|nr:cyclodeaminase/cyclohydrolase family protein [Acidobacteriota bacterium]
MRDLTASVKPAPGGGSVSVVSAVFGLALISKSIAISLRHVDTDSPRHKTLLEVDRHIGTSMERLGAFADADANSFQTYLQARAMPHATGDETQARATTMRNALLDAIRTPLEAASEMCECMAFAESAAKLSDDRVLSDVVAGALLLRASISSVLLNVDINLVDLPDTAIREELHSRRMRLEEAPAQHSEAIRQEFHSRVTDPDRGQV